jgi:hypothetical protein
MHASGAIREHSKIKSKYNNVRKNTMADVDNHGGVACGRD